MRTRSSWRDYTSFPGLTKSMNEQTEWMQPWRISHSSLDWLQGLYVWDCLRCREGDWGGWKENAENGSPDAPGNYRLGRCGGLGDQSREAMVASVRVANG